MSASSPPAPATRRLFVGCVLPPELGREALERATAPLERARHRFPRPDGLHLTLLFLGDVANGPAERLCDALAEALEGASRPDLVLAGTGSFPRRGRERVLWVGLRERAGGGALEELRGRLLTAAERVGIDVGAERSSAFQPHVTVARPRGAPRVPPAFYEVELALDWRPEAVALVESLRVSGGPSRYLERWRGGFAAADP